MIVHPENDKKGNKNLFKRLIIAGTAVIVGIIAVFVFAQTGDNAGRINDFSALAPGQWTEPVKLEVYRSNVYQAVKQKFLSDEIFVSNPRIGENLNIRIIEGEMYKPFLAEDTVVVYQGSLKNMRAAIPGEGFKALMGLDKVQVFYIQFQLDPNAGNEFQGEKAQYSVSSI